ncbi:MAG: DNA topoisomerase IV subunit B [Desulfobacteraceae bacterium]|jgi:topoisomerase-4 subunit B|nr:DNA topoisomerase IV subunit B [Desulfobacteraceae bacterium]
MRPNHYAPYNAESIEVLSGLEPVRRRPGMYTDTSRPNHLGQEVVDNSVDEAIAGFAKQIEVILHEDQSLEVRDDGRGMPVDIHPEEGLCGVELIMTRLHAGAKFSAKNYFFSGGLHGVGVSVVNALSRRLEVEIRRDGRRYAIAFADGDLVEPLAETGTVGQRNTGTTIHFWPNPNYFDSPRFSVPRLRHVLRAKAVLCPGLRLRFIDRVNNDETEWYYEDGLRDYLADSLAEQPIVPEIPFVGSAEGEAEMVHWAVTWLTEGGEPIDESYVNLIPTPLGGTHVNGFRSGLLASIREFCEFRKLIPRNVRLAPDDVWEQCCYVLSVKMQDPQFSGQTKERLSSRQAAAFVTGAVKDAFSLWLNQHTEAAEQIAALAVSHAQKRLRATKQVTRKKITSGPALPGKLSDCVSQDAPRCELFLVEGDSAGGSAKQARDRNFQAVMPLRGKILNTWEVASESILASKEIHDIATALGVDPASEDLDGLRYGKICILADADSDGLHIATLLCALFLRHFLALVRRGHVFVAMPPLYRIDAGKQVFYALDEAEKKGILDRLAAKEPRAKIQVQRFKGLGEMNPIQLRETTMAPDTRRLVQLTLTADRADESVMDMLLSKKRATDRRNWLEEKGNLAEVAEA